MSLSEIRESTKIKLLDKVRRHDYGRYLLKASIARIRGFSGEDISFDFPVTALIGPNGSGKSAVLGAAGCAYKSIKPGTFFPKSAVGDESMSGWRVEYELIDKQASPRQLINRLLKILRHETMHVIPQQVQQDAWRSLSARHIVQLPHA